MNQEKLEQLTQEACFAADGVAIESRTAGDTGAETTRKILRRAIEALYGNGLIEIVEYPPSLWFKADPPYDRPVE